VDSTGGGFVSDTEQQQVNHIVLDGNGDPVQTITESSIVTGNRPMYIWPGVEIPAAANLPPIFGFGSFPAFQPPASGPVVDPTTGPTQWKVGAIPIGLPPELRRAPAGTVVTRAWIIAKIGGIVNFSWGAFGSASGDYALGGFNSSAQLSVNGTLVGTTIVTDGILTTNELREGGTAGLETAVAPMSFAVWARRKNSRRAPKRYEQVNADNNGAEPPNPPYLNIPADEWRSFTGGGISTTTMEDDVFKEVDITRAIRRLFQQRNQLATDYFIVPRPGVGLEIDDDAASLASFGRECSPQVSVGYTVEDLGEDGVPYSYSWSASGQATNFTSLVVKTVHVQVRFPDGLLTTYKCPVLNREGMILPPE
jgi:hypothetical protein